MHIKPVLMACSLVIAATAVSAAPNAHGSLHKGESVEAPADARLKRGYDIEVVNDSYDDLRVYAQYEDGCWIEPFNIYRYEYPHTIDTYHNGYFNNMRVTIDTFRNYRVYDAITRPGSSVRIVPGIKQGQSPLAQMG